MKKLLGIVVLSFLISNAGFAADWKVKNKKVMLGTWQALYLFEHRLEKNTRLLSLHLIGD